MGGNVGVLVSMGSGGCGCGGCCVCGGGSGVVVFCFLFGVLRGMCVGCVGCVGGPLWQRFYVLSPILRRDAAFRGKGCACLYVSNVVLLWTKKT